MTWLNVKADSAELEAEGTRRGSSESLGWIAGGVVTLALATLLAYVPAMGAGFIWDDDRYLTENRVVQSGDWDGLADIWIPGNTPQWYPFVFTSFWIEHKLWGLAPAGYHVVNILLHIANAVLVWRIARRIGVPAAWFAGAVFALHPVQVESVAWITERKNVLSGLFYMLSLLGYLRFKDSRAVWRQVGWYVASLALFVAALLSKSVTATLPAVFVLVLLSRGWRPTLRDLALVGVFFAFGIAFGLNTARLEVEHVGASGSEWDAGFLERLLTACRAMWFYASKILWPAALSFIYTRWDISTAHAIAYAPLLGGVGVLAATGFLAVRRTVAPLLLVLFCAVTLFPALGFLNVYPHRFSFVADHFNYLGSAGYIILFLLLGLRAMDGLLAPASLPAVRRGVGAIVLLALGVLTFRQAQIYTDKVTLWQDTLEKNPQAWIAMVNLAGEYVAADRFDEAERLLQDSVTYPPAHYEAYSGLGQMALEREQYDLAIELFRKAIAAINVRRPEKEWAGAYSNLGVAMQKAGRLDQAAEALEKAVNLEPVAGVPRCNLARVYVAQGRRGEAADQMAETVRYQPKDAGFRNYYAALLLDLERFEQAEAQYRAALALDDDDGDHHHGLIATLWESGKYEEAFNACREALPRFGNDPRLLNRMAWMLATCPRVELRDGEQALGLVTALLKSPKGDPRRNPAALDTYAAALAETGKFPDAVAVARDGLKFARDIGKNELADDIQRRIERYEQGKPWRHARP